MNKFVVAAELRDASHRGSLDAVGEVMARGVLDEHGNAACGTSLDGGGTSGTHVGAAAHCRRRDELATSTKIGRFRVPAMPVSTLGPYVETIRVGTTRVNTTSTRVRLVAIMAVVGIVIAGCGGSSSPKRSFAATAEAICAKTSQSLAMVPAIGGTLKRLAIDVADQLPIYERQLHELSALRPPANRRSAYATALSSARTDITLLRQLYSASRAGNRKKVHDIAMEGSSAYSAAAAAMRRIGLTRCATSG
jgi:hypothetical protein